MPNWCYNDVKITHNDPAMIKRLEDAKGILEEFIPCPKDLREMSNIIERQNKGIRQATDTMKPHRVYNNNRLALLLGIKQPPDDFHQSYIENDIEVSVLC